MRVMGAMILPLALGAASPSEAGHISTTTLDIKCDTAPKRDPARERVRVLA